MTSEEWPTDDPETMPIRVAARRPNPVRWLVRGVLLTVLAFLLVVGWSVGGTLTAPGTDSTSARLAEWGRDHGLGNMVTWLERQQYQRNPPKIGGEPAGGIPVAGGAVSAPNRPWSG